MQDQNINSEELSAWIKLMQTDGVGSGTARNLLTAFGMPQNIFAASSLQLQRVVPERIAKNLAAAISDETLEQIEKTKEWLSKPGNRLITLADADYPHSLLEIPDPPVLLYIKGRLDLLSRPAIAIVGSRNATKQGCRDAETFAEALGNAGWTIISGMALGIDTAAHLGGLSTPSSTVAVIGTGADIVYPSRNRALAHRIAEAGCIISEYPLGMAALPTNFPRRNRIISGLSQGVLVVEAAAKSGSLITAHVAIEQGRDVFAIPGSIHSPLSRGCHQLIRHGAKLVETAKDITEELPKITANPVASGNDVVEKEVKTQEDVVFSVLGFDPLDIDTLSQQLGMDIAELAGRLLELEMEGQVELLPGGFYRRFVS